MGKPRLPLRYFLLVCLLLGAIGVPWGWRVYQERKAAEAERAEIMRLVKELDLLYAKQPMTRDLLPGLELSPNAVAEWHDWNNHVDRIEDRLDKLTRRRGLPPGGW